MLGGMRIPSVPPAQTEPVINSLLYPRLSILGIAISPIIVTEAAITPTQAAKMVPIAMLLTANPPLNPPNHK